ncbi:EAL domain-containing protein [Porphyrobacter sp. GA68]|uniref:EAL domain-containing protein n=1 Tax=Porphyrobacter sp. GA68 TaxID=2883480 RepID=UPI001D196A4D|nr:EAL domain-containing protein [Porphyrobacter sp. GA68]
MAFNNFLARRAGHASTSGAAAKASSLSVRQRLELLEVYEDADLGWFWATDAADAFTYLSPGAAKTLGGDEEFAGKAVGEVFDMQAAARDEAQRSLPFMLRARNSFNRFPVRILKAGPPVWWEISARPCYDAGGTFQGYRGSAKDITLDRLEKEEATRLVRFDVLTGLVNRRTITERLEQALILTRTQKRPCALIMLDLDRFKHINDTLGHQAGDALLLQVAQRLRQIVGDQGEIGRLGGDEFQILLPDCEDRGLLGSLAQRCIQIISQPYLVEGSRATVGASAGIAVAPFDGDGADALTAATDLALYAAKAAGRGQFRFYSSELKSDAELRREVEENLRDAIASDELTMFYQPIVDLRSNKVSCFEALLRWNRPHAGFISPAIFIPVAEDTGMIAELGRAALMQACRDAAAWPAHIKVAVNVSAIQFADDDFPLRVREALDESGLHPARLELEITESVFLGDVEVAEHMLRRLKKLGVRLALDDFGTGYSSLSYLSNAPYDKIKIDQSFVRGATAPDNNNRAILKAIIDLAGSLGMDTVAEGAEAHDELELVRSLGASHAQGFIYARAEAQADVLSRLAEGRDVYEPSGPAYFRADRMTVIRKVGVVHENHRYDAFMRNLSRTGARIEGLLDVPVGTQVVVDLGDGQLAVAVVRRSQEAELGVEFETPLVSDGAGGLCTRYRVSPYALHAASNAAIPLRHSDPADRGVTDAFAPHSKFVQVELNWSKYLK